MQWNGFTTIFIVIIAVDLFAGCAMIDAKEINEQLVPQSDEEAEIVLAQQIKGIEKTTSPPLQKTTVVTGENKPAPRPGGVMYMGVIKCKVCHHRQYWAWVETSMATSFENLEPGVKAAEKVRAGIDPDKDYTADENCLPCHTTGYGKPGGFVSLEKTPKLINVQCEGCHGPGGEYIQIMRENKYFRISEVKAFGLIVPNDDRNGCLECHGGKSPFNEKVDPKYRFNFRERLQDTHQHFPLKYAH
jgi:hypothetical protein